MITSIRTLALLGAIVMLGWLTNEAPAQQPTPDRVETLKKTLSNSKQDATRVNTLNKLSELDGWRVGNLEAARSYALSAKTLAEKLQYRAGTADYLNNFGSISWMQGNYPEALKFFKEALAIREEIGDKSGVAGAQNNIGAVFQIQGNYPEALKAYYAALRINEALNNKDFISANHNNIGTIYIQQNNPEDALKAFRISLQIREEMADTFGIAECRDHLGVILSNQRKYPEALEQHFIALRLREKIGNKEGLSNSYANIGAIYSEQGKYAEALKQYQASLAISEEIGDQYGIASCYNNIGSDKIDMDNARGAKDDFSKGLEIATAIGAVDLLMDSYQGLFQADSALGNFKGAFENHRQYIRFRDSLNNEENTRKSVQTQMQYAFDKKEEATKAEQEKKDIRQRNIRNSIAAGFLGSLIFLGVVYRQRNKINKEKKRSEELLLNILPEEVAEELKARGAAEAKQIDEVTVLFTDFKGFTQLSEELTPKALVAEINECFSAFDHIMQKHGVEKIKTIGDAYMAAGGLPTANSTHAHDVVLAALDVQQFMLEHKAKKQAAGSLFFEIRIGVHTGPVVAGIVGVKKFAYDIWGDTVNTASRMESSGEVGKVNISGTTHALVQDKFICTPRGKIQAKGKGEIEMYFVEGSKGLASS